MSDYAHKILVETVARLDVEPADEAAFAKWIQGVRHLEFLRQNALDEELVIYASSAPGTFIHSVVVPNDQLRTPDQADLLRWSLHGFESFASYVSSGSPKRVWIERGSRGVGSDTMQGATQLIFGREFEGLSGPDRVYYELHQEYAHLNGIHWRPELRAYCRFDEHGDFDPVVSITNRADSESRVALISFHWEPLEEYLSAANASLVRMFDFTLTRKDKFSGWSHESPRRTEESPHLFYRQQTMAGLAGYTRGVQIIHPRRTPAECSESITGGWTRRKERQYAEFVANDWRNRRVIKISTDPDATANYFQTDRDTLPYEMSPAFFRPEVLSKYKADRDKYTVGDREVSCRGAWHIQSIDMNEAGQIHAYICYLRQLPYAEQVHWLAHNEPPKTGISKRAITNDFMGEFVDDIRPLAQVLSILHGWHGRRVSWWAPKDESLFERVNVPVTKSRDEWAEAFMDLAKLVVEGFETKTIRTQLVAKSVPFEKTDGTIVLLEKYLNGAGEVEEPRRLEGLRTVQAVRSKAKGHASGNEAHKLAQDVLKKHRTYAAHFEHVCAQVAEEMEIIEHRFS